MGEVWKARDTRLGRTVAIKKVKEQHSERFKQEARSIAALNHPNICQIFDIGDDYLVLEYIEGKPLSSPLPEQEAVKLAILRRPTRRALSTEILSQVTSWFRTRGR